MPWSIENRNGFQGIEKVSVCWLIKMNCILRDEKPPKTGRTNPFLPFSIIDFGYIVYYSQINKRQKPSKIPKTWSTWYKNPIYRWKAQVKDLTFPYQNTSKCYKNLADLTHKGEKTEGARTQHDGASKSGLAMSCQKDQDQDPTIEAIN